MPSDVCASFVVRAGHGSQAAGKLSGALPFPPGSAIGLNARKINIEPAAVSLFNKPSCQANKQAE